MTICGVLSIINFNESLIICIMQENFLILNSALQSAITNFAKVIDQLSCKYYLDLHRDHIRCVSQLH